VEERGKAKGSVHGVFSAFFCLRMVLDIVWGWAWGFGFCIASIDADGASGAGWVQFTCVAGWGLGVNELRHVK